MLYWVKECPIDVKQKCLHDHTKHTQTNKQKTSRENKQDIYSITNIRFSTMGAKKIFWKRNQNNVRLSYDVLKNQMAPIVAFGTPMIKVNNHNIKTKKWQKYQNIISIKNQKQEAKKAREKLFFSGTFTKSLRKKRKALRALSFVWGKERAVSKATQFLSLHDKLQFLLGIANATQLAHLLSDWVM